MKKTMFSEKSLQSFYKKIRLFDVLILLLLASVAVLIFMFLARKSEYVNVTIKLGDDSITNPLEGIPPWYLNQLSSGMVEKDLLGRANAEVLKVYTYQLAPNRRVTYADLRIRVVYSKSAQSYTFNSRPVLIGNTLRVNPANILVEGLITNIDGVPDVREKKTIRLETQVFGSDQVFPNTTGVYDYVANAIKVGDQVTDSTGHPIITVVNKRVEPAKRVVTTNNGSVFLTQDPLKKDLFLTLDVDATKFGEYYYLFDQIRIAVDTSIPIQLPTVTLYSTVTKMDQ